MRLATRFGAFGGVFVPEVLMPALEELELAFIETRADVAFSAELGELLRSYAGRPTPLYRCRRFGAGGAATIWLKREDLLHGGAHKINQALAQALLARRMGKRRLIAETGAGQHGVATAMAGTLMGFTTRIYMGADDVARQRANVGRMELLGAEVVSVTTGSRTLKDAINAALRDWTGSYESTHYLLGTAAGPHPFPTMVREFQRVIGDEARAQCLEAFGALPGVVLACVGGGSNAIGIFSAFAGDPEVALTGIEAGGWGLDTARHAATLSRGAPGVLHGARTLVLQDADGQVSEAHSLAPGLDYPAVGPEHAHLQATGRARYVARTDTEALAALAELARTEGIIPAIESSHALAEALEISRAMPAPGHILVNLSGRGDKDLDTVLARLGPRPLVPG